MGTRHVVAVHMDGEYKVAQYGQWDGYPSGQGEAIRAFFAQKGFDMERFRDRVGKCFFLNKDQIEMVNAKIQKHGGFEESGYEHLSRDAGADILQFVYDSEEGLGLSNAIDFVGDSLMCEWAYVVDLDKNVLEVFEGFNKSPLDPSERFAKSNSDFEHRTTRYYPVKFLCSIPLSELPEFDICGIGREDDEEEEEE